MKKHQLFLFAAICILIVSCSRRVYIVRQPLPPGQAKKITGQQSARAYAPGQQKKKKTVVVVSNNR